MSIWFAVGHGAATTPLVYASSSLDQQVAYLGNGLLYVTTLVSALVLAIPFVGFTGPKGGLVGGMLLYAVYAACFSLASLQNEAWFQGVFFIFGSLCGGLAAGIVWTAEGAYMVNSASMIAEQESQNRESINSQLATTFAFYYLLLEVVAKIMWSLLMLAGASADVTGWIYVVLAAMSAYAMTWICDIRSEAKAERPVLAKLMGAVHLWSDVRIWLISPTNITFGFAAAYLNGVFNATVAAREVGASYIGFLSAFTVFNSWVLTWLYGSFAQQCGNLIPISIGAGSFACIQLFYFLTSGCDGWGWWILIFYALQGSGRCVYESANKAVFADTFKGSLAEGAFANCVLQMSLAQAICFFASAAARAEQLQIIVIIFAFLTPIGYIAKIYMGNAAELEDTPLLDKAEVTKSA